MNKNYEVYIIYIGEIGYYIGITSRGLKKRKGGHLSSMRHNPNSNPNLYLAMKNNSYKFALLEKFIGTKTFASSREVYWISKYKKESLKISYNILSGGYAPKGKEHNQAKNKKYWTTNSSRIKDFKKTCEVMNWEFCDFIQIFDVTKSIKDKHKNSYYFHYYKDYIIPKFNYKIGILKPFEVRAIKDKYMHFERKYENTPTTIANFKKLCNRIGLDYHQYKLKPLNDTKKIGLSSKYFVYHKNRIPKTKIYIYLDIDKIKKISGAGSNNRAFIDIRRCKEQPTSRGSFKKMCKLRGLKFEYFIEKLYSKNSKSGLCKYTYTINPKFKDDKTEPSYE